MNVWSRLQDIVIVGKLSDFIPCFWGFEVMTCSLISIYVGLLLRWL